MTDPIVENRKNANPTIQVLHNENEEIDLIISKIDIIVDAIGDKKDRTAICEIDDLIAYCTMKNTKQHRIASAALRYCKDFYLRYNYDIAVMSVLTSVRGYFRKVIDTNDQLVSMLASIEPYGVDLYNNKESKPDE